MLMHGMSIVLKMLWGVTLTMSMLPVIYANIRKRLLMELREELRIISNLAMVGL